MVHRIANDFSADEFNLQVKDQSVSSDQISPTAKVSGTVELKSQTSGK
jgi:hypothetical protein